MSKKKDYLLKMPQLKEKNRRHKKYLKLEINNQLRIRALKFIECFLIKRKKCIRSFNSRLFIHGYLCRKKIVCIYQIIAKPIV